MSAPTLAEQLREVGREIGLRKNVYPRFVANGKMTQAEADRHIECLEAVYATLKKLNSVQAAP